QPKCDSLRSETGNAGVHRLAALGETTRLIQTTPAETHEPHLRSTPAPAGGRTLTGVPQFLRLQQRR
ncbi:hypothetical protein OAK20_02500, partial [Synechococcus sp. AH-551-P21]|nr:hypothetical protein [Synechococcus sp. AH-551-P21]